jgi:hypothetical protein
MRGFGGAYALQRYYPWVVISTQRLITLYGWRAAFFILAALLAAVAAPLNYFFQCQRPEEMDLKRDFGKGAPQSSTRLGKTVVVEGPSLKQALKIMRFWALAFGVLAGAIPLHMVLIDQVAALSDSAFHRNWRRCDWG